jgi:carbonic anhydrase
VQVVSQANSSFTPLSVGLETVNRSEILVENIYGLLVYATTVNTLTQFIAGKEVTVGIIEYHPLVTSEHLFNGIHYPFGLVIITGITHYDDKMEVIMGLEIFFKEGKPNPFLQSLIEEDGEVSISSIIPLSGVIDDYYYYSGSADLPWPDCWETVSWVIPNYVLEASAAQIDYWAERYVQDLSFSNGRGNVRDVQPLNNRTIYHFVPD